jgi:hypothetical protein
LATAFSAPTALEQSGVVSNDCLFFNSPQKPCQKMNILHFVALLVASSVYSGPGDTCTLEELGAGEPMKLPLFDNCTSALDLDSSSDSTADDILPSEFKPKSQDEIDRICDALDCVNNLKYVFQLMPNCLIEGMNYHEKYRYAVDALCNTMPEGVLTTNGDPCARADLATIAIVGAMLPMWTNCSSALSFDNVTSDSAVLQDLLHARTKEGGKSALEIHACEMYVEARIARMPNCVLVNEDESTTNPKQELETLLAAYRSEKGIGSDSDASRSNSPTSDADDLTLEPTPTLGSTTTPNPNTTQPSAASLFTWSRSIMTLLVMVTIAFD